MNDAGLDEPLNETQKRIEGERKEEEDFEQEEEQTFLNPSRWWFASTAFPLLAGTFGPMATAFNICALIEHWRVEIPPGFGANESHGLDVRDPKWLLAVNGVSLGLAIIANFSLLLNMARRLSFSVAQPITILGWYLSSFLLIADLASIVHIVKVPGQRRALTQAFYYAIFAAALYFIIASLMVFTVVGAWRGHYSKEFKLNMSQRTLMLQTISFMIYMVGGAGVYAKIEGWLFLDALYFTNYTLLTVGIGDYAPSTHLGRGLLFPYAIGGIVILGLVIGSIRSLVLERGKKKLASRLVEKKRELLLKTLIEKGETDKLNPIQSKQHAEEVGMSERERRKTEFELMRKIQQQASTRQKWQALLVSGSAWLFLWLIGAVVFYKAEHEQQWSYFQSVYFSYTTLLTIGFGDYKPFSNSGKAFFVFWSLLAVPTLTIVISNMGDTVVKVISDLTLYLGEFTVLPGDAPVRDRMKRLANKSTNNRLFEDAPDFKEPPGMLPQKPDTEKGAAGGPGAAATDFLAAQVEDEELKEAREAEARGDTLREDLHKYHYLLVKEFRNVMKHLNESPPRKYSYEEWAWFLKLMGEDESHSASHRTAPVKVDNDTDGKPDMQQAQTDDEQGRTRQWSWLGNRSPLMGDTEEAEWVLEKLSMTLEKEMKELSDAKTKKDYQGRGDNAGRRIHSTGDSDASRSDKTLQDRKGFSADGIHQGSPPDLGIFPHVVQDPRTVSVSITTYIATTVVLVLWLLAAVAVAIYLFLYQRKRAQKAQRTQGTSSLGNATLRCPPSDLTALPSYPQRGLTSPYPSIDSSSFPATTRPTDVSPVLTPPNADPIQPNVPTKINEPGRTTTVSPTRNPVPAPPSSNKVTQRALLANNPTQAANLARLQAMTLASDTTDMSTETVEPGKEVVNAGYMTMLAQRGVPLRDHALLGSDDSTDAEGRTAAALGYAMHARGRGSSAWGVDPARYGGRFVGQRGRGRAMTFGQGRGDAELERMRPLQVRKMSSM